MPKSNKPINLDDYDMRLMFPESTDSTKNEAKDIESSVASTLSSVHDTVDPTTKNGVNLADYDLNAMFPELKDTSRDKSTLEKWLTPSEKTDVSDVHYNGPKPYTKPNVVDRTVNSSIGDLEETNFGFISGRKFTAESVIAYANKLRQEGMTEQEIVKELKAKKATPRDMTSYSLARRHVPEPGQDMGYGARRIYESLPTMEDTKQKAKDVVDYLQSKGMVQDATSSVIANPLKVAAKVVKTVLDAADEVPEVTADSSILEDQIVTPAKQVGVAAAYQLTSIATEAARATVWLGDAVGLISDESARSINANADLMETKLQLAKENVKIAQEKFRQKYGTGSAVADIGEAGIPVVAMLYNPSSIAAMALTSGVATYGDARWHDYSKQQSLALSILTSTVVGTFSKLADVYTSIKANAQADKALFTEDITSLDQLPKNYLNQVRRIQRDNKWSDTDTLNIVNSYRKGVENGALRGYDVVRVLSSSPEANANTLSLVDDVLLNDQTLARSMVSEVDKRANNAVNMIKASGDDKLIKIMNSPSVLRIHGGKKAINWKGLSEKVRGHDWDTGTGEVKNLIEYNTKMFEDFDYASFLVLQELKPFKSSSNIGKDIVKYQLTKGVARAMGQHVLMPYSVPRNIVHFFGRRFATSASKIEKSLAKSFERGLEPIQIGRQLKADVPDIDDIHIDNFVRSMDKELAVTQASNKSTIENPVVSTGTKPDKELAVTQASNESTTENPVVSTGTKPDKELAVTQASNKSTVTTETLVDTSNSITYAPPKEYAESITKISNDVDTLYTSKAGSYSDTLHEAKMHSLNEIFGDNVGYDYIQWKGSTGKHPSEYFVAHRDSFTPEMVRTYYTVNPSKLKDDTFGIPKNVLTAYKGAGLKQLPNRVPKGRDPKIGKGDLGPLASQEADIQIANRSKLGKPDENCGGK